MPATINLCRRRTAAGPALTSIHLLTTSAMLPQGATGATGAVSHSSKGHVWIFRC